MSADNAIAVFRTRSNRGDGSYDYRLAEYGVSGEPFERSYHTSVSVGKAVDTAEMRKQFPIHDFIDGPIPEDYEALDLTRLVGDIHSPSHLAGCDFGDTGSLEGQLLVVDGFVAITFHCAQDFVAMFARSEVFTDLGSAMTEVQRMEEESYVEYGSECVCVDATWDELLAQAEVVRLRRLTCLVRGPDAPKEEIGNWDSRQDFKYLGNPGIEDKLEGWGWPADVIEATMAKVTAQYWDWKSHRQAENLRLARAGDKVEMERYRASKAKGCCQSHDEVIVVQSEFAGEVHVHFGFNFGH